LLFAPIKEEMNESKIIEQSPQSAQKVTKKTVLSFLENDSSLPEKYEPHTFSN
jgi:hypothetical protein